MYPVYVNNLPGNARPSLNEGRPHLPRGKQQAPPKLHGHGSADPSLHPSPALRLLEAVHSYIAATGRTDNELHGRILHRTDGIGLSTPQVGINEQLMVFTPVVECGEGEEIVLVNPRVTRYSQKMRPFNEGCLSFLGIYADVVVQESRLLVVYPDF
nr:peptide deformylase 1B, chloroplastic-like [Malus domestica]